MGEVYLLLFGVNLFQGFHPSALLIEVDI